MKVCQVLPGIGERASGPTYTVTSLCEALALQGHEVELHVLDLGAPQASSPRWALHVHPASRLLPRLGISPSFYRGLRDAVGRCDVVHTHSLWMFPNFVSGFLRFPAGCRMLISPRGTISPWAWRRSRLRKLPVWLAAQRRAMRRADCFHATSQDEADAVRRLGLTQPVAVIPNGIDLPPLGEPTPQERRRLLFLSRIHPKKGLPTLLRAWAQVAPRFPDWELQVVGRDQLGHRAELERVRAELGVARVRFEGPVYGEAKARAFQEAELFVLPTHNENFGVVVAEALAHGVPAITTHGAPWSGLADEGCGWWIPHGVEPLARCLAEALACDRDALRSMGLRGRGWVERAFSWERVGAMTSETYAWLLGGGARPAWVQ